MRSALVALALLVAGPALADVPPHLGRALGEARPAGSGRLTWFGLHVYDARLFVRRRASTRAATPNSRSRSS